MAEQVQTPSADQQVEDSLKAAGFVEGAAIDQVTDSQGMPIPGDASAGGDTPAEPQKPSAPTPSAEDKLAQLQEQMKSLEDKARWSDREKERADTERKRADELFLETQRLKTALNMPTQPTVTLTPEQQAAEEQGRAWLKGALPALIPEVLKSVPEEVLVQLPVFRKMSQGMMMLSDQLEQSRFLSTFERKDREAIQKQIIPTLQQARITSGFQKSYAQLWDDQKNAIQEVARLAGLGTPAPQSPPSAVPHAPAPPTLPPSLSGVSGGGNVPTGKPSTPWDADTLSVFGQGDR